MKCKRAGIAASVIVALPRPKRIQSKVKKHSWMEMFHVGDPDDNRIFFAFTEDNTHGNPWYGE